MRICSLRRLGALFYLRVSADGVFHSFEGRIA